MGYSNYRRGPVHIASPLRSDAERLDNDLYLDPLQDGYVGKPGERVWMSAFVQSVQRESGAGGDRALITARDPISQRVYRWREWTMPTWRTGTQVVGEGTVSEEQDGERGTLMVRCEVRRAARRRDA